AGHFSHSLTMTSGEFSGSTTPGAGSAASGVSSDSPGSVSHGASDSILEFVPGSASGSDAASGRGSPAGSSPFRLTPRIRFNSSHINSSFVRPSRCWEETPITPVISPIVQAKILERTTRDAAERRAALHLENGVAARGSHRGDVAPGLGNFLEVFARAKRGHVALWILHVVKVV